MTHTINVDAPRPLTGFERRQVQAYAFSLAAQRGATVPSADAAAEPRRISFEGWAGRLAGIENEKTGKRSIPYGWHDLIKKWEK